MVQSKDKKIAEMHEMFSCLKDFHDTTQSSQNMNIQAFESAISQLRAEIAEQKEKEETRALVRAEEEKILQKMKEQRVQMPRVL